MGGTSKLFNTSPFFFLFLFLELRFYSCSVHNAVVLCPENEKQALLRLKQSLSDPLDLILSSWNGEASNCCSWTGVVCSNFSGGGHVHQLHLGGYDLTGKLNPSLLNLTYLRYLDLSYNNFSGETIPSFFGSFTALKYLNFSYSNFEGTLPHTIGNLSKLNTLSLEGGYGLIVNKLEWVWGLHQLEHLNLNSVDLYTATNWVQLINKLPSLKELHLYNCNLTFFGSLNVVNASSLSTLDLSSNYFPTCVPKWMFQLSNLVYLDISNCRFEGPIPNIISTTKLQHINISSNNFNLTIPNWVYSCKDLVYVDFSSNLLRDTISSDIGNLMSLIYLDLSNNDLFGELPSRIGNSNKMVHLSLSGNKLHGQIPYSFGNMSKLELMDLSQNELKGAIPTSLGTLSPSLKQLTLSSNKLSGNLPESLGQLFNLESLDIDDNMLKGVVTENHFVNLTNLKYFSASGNHLTLKVKQNWIPPFQLEELKLVSWSFIPNKEIPPWLETQKSLWDLDLSNTGISGTIPHWIWNIGHLNLSLNNLYGKLPDTIGVIGDGLPLHYISLRSNQLSGPLPRVAYTLDRLDLSNNSFTGGLHHFLCGTDTGNATNYLDTLLLDENQLSGELPDCWTDWPYMWVLNLGNNNFSGSIPNSIGIAKLLSLQLYGNKLSGQIPPLSECIYLFHIDLGNNNLEGNIPASWMAGEIPYLAFLILHSNKLSGKIPLEVCHFDHLQILDLSNNNFHGPMPECFENFTAMVEGMNQTSPSSFWNAFSIDSVSITTKGRVLNYDATAALVTHIDLSRNNLSGEIPKEFTRLVELRSFNLSSNHLTGEIPGDIGNMKRLESLDLSRNLFLGEIPNSFTGMFSLSYLNLSHNNLTGKIPASTQLQGMDPSSFVGNNLCGPPLPHNCSSYVPSEFTKPMGNDDEEGDKAKRVQWLYVFASLGYAMGLSLTCSILILKKSWRVVLFGFVEDTWEETYVYFYNKWKRLRRQLRGGSPNRVV